MSGVAAINAREATVGLVPRYLRGGDAANGEPDAPEAEQPAPPPAARDREEEPLPPVIRRGAPTEELRRRIAEATNPERRGPGPLWFGLAALALLAAAGALFPGAVVALLPHAGLSF